jgi:hypothetical protein
MTSSLNIYVVALTYFLVATAVIPMGFALFKTPYQLWEVAAASLVGALLYLLPTVGPIASLAGTLGVLWWRLGQGYWTDIATSVGVARLVMVPVLLLIKIRAQS